MADDYQAWIIPKERAFRAGSAQVASLANGLRAVRWAPAPDAPGQYSRVRELLPGFAGGIGKKPVMEFAFEAEPLTAAWVEFHSRQGCDFLNFYHTLSS